MSLLSVLETRHFRLKEKEYTINAQNHNGLSDLEVTYVLSSNLLSVNSIAKSGYVTLFDDEKGCRIFNKKSIKIKGELLLQAKETNGTYTVKLKVETNTNMALKSKSISNTEVNRNENHITIIQR